MLFVSNVDLLAGKCLTRIIYLRVIAQILHIYSKYLVCCCCCRKTQMTFYKFLNNCYISQTDPAKSKETEEQYKQK